MTGLALAAASCGGGGGDDGGKNLTVDATDGSVAVEAHDVYFDATQINAKPGPLEVSLEEKGSQEHTFKIEGIDDFGLKVSAGSKSESGTVELEAGEYKYFCSVAGHEGQGMKGELVVK